MTTEKIFVGIDNERVELTGEDKEKYLAQRALDDIQEKLKADKAEARAVQKAALLERLGISEDEARLLLS